MRILQLCNKPPIPTVDGGCIAINNISKGLINENHNLKILTASTEKHPFLSEEIPSDFKKATAIEGIFLDTRVNIVDAFSALVTSDSYNISRFYSPDFDRRLKEILEEDNYDIVHLESLFMTPYIDTIRKNSDAKIILRSHNLEHIIWERLANTTGNKAKRVYLKHLASKLKKYELDTINMVDGIAAITDEDTVRFKELDCTKPLVTIPFGIDLENYPYTPKEIENRIKLFHIGAMNWEPNKEAINWFIDEIWPDLKDLNVECHLAGRSMPSYLHNHQSEKMFIHGEVDSATDFMNNNDVMIVPLLSGSGIRIKIIEGMAMGKAIITTSIGAEGIGCTHNKDILIADTAEEFAKVITQLIDHPSRIPELGAEARKLIENNYTNSSIIKKLISFYES